MTEDRRAGRAEGLRTKSFCHFRTTWVQLEETEAPGSAQEESQDSVSLSVSSLSTLSPSLSPHLTVGLASSPLSAAGEGDGATKGQDSQTAVG